jgi:hypothetical protein
MKIAGLFKADLDDKQNSGKKAANLPWSAVEGNHFDLKLP